MRFVKSIISTLSLLSIAVMSPSMAAVKVLNFNVSFGPGAPMANISGTATVSYTPGTPVNYGPVDSITLDSNPLGFDLSHVIFNYSLLRPKFNQTEFFGIGSSPMLSFQKPGFYIETFDFIQSGEKYVWSYYTDGTRIHSSNIPSVPEPSTWALLILGFGATGLVLRSRRRAARVMA